MKILKTFEQHISESLHGRFEIYGTKNGVQELLGYAKRESAAEDLKKDFEKDSDFENVWWIDTEKEPALYY